ncbi:MAG: hypothetical protein VX278_00045 [Myxococcota bacterium]|nr:hypothetical protein [Myxococcota bacterium]
MFSIFIASFVANAYVAEECRDFASSGPPEGWSQDDEVAQQDFLLNYFSLATTFSPAHAPIPGLPGEGMVGVELSVIPPLGCDRRLVLFYTKTEDTNKVPVLPRPRLSFTFPSIQMGPVKGTIYGSLGYVPPLPLMGTQNVIVSAEAGIGFGEPEENGLQYGLRYHATLLKTVAEIATPFEEGAETMPDFYMGSTFGGDVLFGYKSNNFTPYLAVGFTDVSTFFYIDDDGIVINNKSPYQGLVASVGTQWRPTSNIQVSAELYSAPGYITTGRLNLGLLFK